MYPLSAGDKVESPGRPKQPEYITQSSKEESSHSEKISEICIEPPVHPSTTSHLKKLREVEERTT